ncbi:gamma carbonic anhydrase family protein [Neorhodopirellula pilleata]|uniref:2,3,4,5-tetrahydropyridine-2,6-dicarboxylate N-acetyltransferase n=1 Tax=Neorhodopirellula pilleata TaxID=2714738 RepID=A0A5C5ZW88_9BACT|nr:gamma carbonic anhydrase family protein [Neorhodopirellula pilleata]TWT91854.1 2,3,4,5-tetrahydropyridine-2,6-dicarboxylate N-acetyltransferase [Neorhodopirellula pilleata]
MNSRETKASSDSVIDSDIHEHRVDQEICRRESVVTSQTDYSLIDPSAFIAPGAVVLGQVHIAADASVWFGAVMRGDTERIEIGARSNVQDQCVLHCDPGKPCIIGADVTIGHAAIVHGAVIEDEALIGIGAIVLNGARVGRGAIIGAGALVTENTVIPPGMLAVGSPAKPIKPVSEELARRCREGTAHYVALAAEYRQRFSTEE